MQKITPCLWFDTQAEEATQFYVSVFRDARMGAVTRYGEGGPRPEGSVLTVAFELEGQPFAALNGGPQFKFNEAISLVVDCADQAEVDRLWATLTEDGQPGPCGWLKDRYGLSWQIVPSILLPLLGDPDAAKAHRVMSAMRQMGKLDITALLEAAAG